MLIDFHIHAFPDNLAERAVGSLAEKSGFHPVTDGTISNTREKMKKWGIDYGIVLNIATNPKQQTKVNLFAKDSNKDNIISFGSVNPFSSDALCELDRIKEYGLKGIKLHPEYQEYDIDNEMVYPIYKKASDLGLIMVFHGGKDVAYPNSLRAHPKAIRKFADDFKSAKIVIAHYGGYRLYDEVLEHLAGSHVYIDTSCDIGTITPEKAKEIIKAHGADKVLFGSDCPWQDPGKAIEFINSLGLSDEEKDAIFYKNALNLLKL